MTASARALRGVTALACLTFLVGLALVAHPLLARYDTTQELWIGLAAGTLLALVGAYDVIAVARGNVETLAWRSALPALVGIAVTVSPVFGYSTSWYAGGTVAAGIAIVALSLANAWVSTGVTVPLPRVFPRARA